MKKFALFLIYVLFAVTDALPQNVVWEKMQTDDGEFSMKVPAGCYSHFHSPDGFTVKQPKSAERFSLKEMRLISCYTDRTLMNVEIYESEQPRNALKALIASLKIDGSEILVNTGTGTAASKKDFYAVEQTGKRQDSFFVQMFVAGKKHIYVVTAAARGLPNKTTETFVNSLRFLSAEQRRSIEPPKETEKTVTISALKSVVPELIYETGVSSKSNPPETGVKANDDAAMNKAIVLSLPQPSFTKTARINEVSGNISLRLTLGADGRIHQFRVLRTLPDGLLREAVIAAMRIKFLPAEQNGKPLPDD